MRWILVRSRNAIAGAVILASAACSAGGLGSPTDSGTEGVPIPATAIAQDGGWRVPDATTADVRAWYDDQLPADEPFGDWQWCEAFTAGPYYQRTYHHPDTSDALIVVVVDDEPPGILITADDSGPC